MHGISNYVIMCEGKIAYPNVGIWYTDGSGLNNCFGAGVYGPRDNHRESSLMGSLCKVFQAILMAILRSADVLLSKNVTIRRIHICSDSRALTKATTESALI
jgi:hypothetical protein